jgi:hypothetical protein
MNYAIVAPSPERVTRLNSTQDGNHNWLREFGSLPNDKSTSLTSLAFHQSAGNTVLEFSAETDEAAVGSLNLKLSQIGNPPIFVLLSRQVGRVGGEVVVRSTDRQPAAAAPPPPGKPSEKSAPPVQTAT